jgi:hypothetical protein
LTGETGDCPVSTRTTSLAANSRTKRIADVCAHGTDDRGVFCQHYDTTALDASALLIPLAGFLPPDDPRVQATVLAIADELTEDDLVLRYRVEETDDGFSGEEGTFTICSFWLVSALTEIGEVDRARALCEKLRSHASPHWTCGPRPPSSGTGTHRHPYLTRREGRRTPPGTRSSIRRLAWSAADRELASTGAALPWPRYKTGR